MHAGQNRTDFRRAALAYHANGVTGFQLIWLVTFRFMRNSLRDAVKLFYEPDHCQCVLTAVVQQRLSNPVALVPIQSVAQQRLPSQSGGLPVRHLHIIVSHLGHECREHRFQ